jgi:signal transduction histidine kinase
MKFSSQLRDNLDIQIILVALLFFASACLGYFLSFQSTTVLPAWPPSGIGLALIILVGRRAWPGLAMGALIANLMAYWNNNSTMSTQSIMIVSSSIALSITLEVLAGNFLITKWISEDYPFRTTRHAFQFLFITVLISIIGALISTAALFLNSVIAQTDILRISFSSWVGDTVGILLFTPLILSIAEGVKSTFTKQNFINIGIFLIYILGIGLLLQMELLTTTLKLALPFLVLPVLLWMAFRFELRFAMGGVLVISLLAIYFTSHNFGPFVLEDPNYSIVLLQIFIAVMSTSTIVLSATVKERENVQAQLLQFNETLEIKVSERTSALNEEVTTRRLAEEKLQHTNQELSKRNTELDNFVYSVSHDLRAPIASVLGLINLAKKDDGALKDMYLDMIHKSAQQQDHFIREILDQSRNSRLDVKREEIEFQAMIDETFNQLKFATNNGQNENLTKIVKISQEKPFFSDRWRLKVMLNNVISNAIRYRNGKDPIIHVNVLVNDDYATVEIEDNGKGIASEHLAHVCRMFYRATDDGAGSGLGLYIVKETIDKLKGKLDIDSEIGRGTRVKLEIPEVVG